MANRVVRRATPRRSDPRGAYVALVKTDEHSIAQLEADRMRREEFERGCRWAGRALVGMFAVLSIGCVMGAW